MTQTGVSMETDTRAEIPQHPVPLAYPKHALRCTSCPYNGRTDAEAAYAHISCPGRGDSCFNDGQELVFTGCLEDADEFIDDHKLEGYEEIIKGDGGKITNLPEETENALKEILGVFLDMSICDCVMLFCFLHGMTYQEIADICGLSKQFVWKHLQKYAIFTRLRDSKIRRFKTVEAFTNGYELRKVGKGDYTTIKKAVVSNISDIAKISGVSPQIVKDRMKAADLKDGASMNLGCWRIEKSGEDFIVENMRGRKFEGVSEIYCNTVLEIADIVGWGVGMVNYALNKQRVPIINGWRVERYKSIEGKYRLVRVVGTTVVLSTEKESVIEEKTEEAENRV